MRFERDVVHPAIFEASDKIVYQVLSAGAFQGSPEQMKAFAEHQAVWRKEYGPGLWTAIGACVASFLALVALKGIGLTGPMMGVLAATLVAFWMVYGYVAYRRNMRQLTPAELKALTPALDITPIQRVYAEALVAAAEARLPEDQFKEVVAQLNRLVDEEARLNALRDRGVGAPATHEEIQAEHARITERLLQTDDPVTRSALQRSLEICENRLHATRELSLVGQRVDAQLEMVGQAIRSIRDSLIRLHTAPASTIPTIDLDAVRQTVDVAHRHSVALEQAVEEVRTLA